MAFLTGMEPRNEPVLAFDRTTVEGFLRETITRMGSDAWEEDRKQKAKQAASGRSMAGRGERCNMDWRGIRRTNHIFID